MQTYVIVDRLFLVCPVIFRIALFCSQDADLPGSSGAPENLTFKERQRLFSQGQDVSNKVKASRKLTELENELNTKWKKNEEDTLYLPQNLLSCGFVGASLKRKEEGGYISKWFTISVSKIVGI